MEILFCMLKTIIGYFVLMFIGPNLLGLVVRGIVPTQKKDALGNLVQVDDTTSASSRILTIIAIALCILYIYALSHFWNLGITFAAIILMFVRLNDLLDELETGEKFRYKKYLPRKAVDNFFSILAWIPLPIIYYFLCHYIKP